MNVTLRYVFFCVVVGVVFYRWDVASASLNWDVEVTSIHHQQVNHLMMSKVSAVLTHVLTIEFGFRIPCTNLRHRRQKNSREGNGWSRLVVVDDDTDFLEVS